MNKGKIQKFLVGVDDSADALLAFDYAIKRAKDEGAELIITSVLESDELSVYQAMDKDYIHGKREDLEEHILDYRQRALAAGVTNVRTIVGEGDAGETIVKEIIPQVDPDLLIIGSESKKGIRRHFGSQAAYMAKYSPTSVLVVR
ncbi:universal stress protein [Liquorilactobacillus satsumensis]|uniref:Universal stress protein UspA-like nucleotide-binding protein n=1 Tax=Liquorilactobacillus satsumensis DSM 16230 = JCM 12392 TaxID=1423801 RepID=A0A0R1UU97_9LACO|nr:universal stress protein [Liquorilactobacillus satsumensis]KRL96752.1 universal stress protein UspA-like nucleotide-binding protein [Liquorilactobacillus satsumensis DSM 16230 = JCM 12392]MCC7666099.1 universal stress protein [Liquorilactobacillus satsumensis]MCP9312552.1 universal stress protein [Liquorilactobacillus satsumensis]MCP9328855.1 universal stress protein [Liquorilactobacillus satsumensis]MCP9356795.1 universal stress protein [Liquorilactobacillus satsumensis]